jgi:hypothetical protein
MTCEISSCQYCGSATEASGDSRRTALHARLKQVSSTVVGTIGRSPCRVTMRVATACTELNSTRCESSGANRRNSDRYTGSNVPR